MRHSAEPPIIQIVVKISAKLTSPLTTILPSPVRLIMGKTGESKVSQEEMGANNGNGGKGHGHPDKILWVGEWGYLHRLNLGYLQHTIANDKVNVLYKANNVLSAKGRDVEVTFKDHEVIFPNGGATESEMENMRTRLHQYGIQDSTMDIDTRKTNMNNSSSYPRLRVPP